MTYSIDTSVFVPSAFRPRHGYGSSPGRAHEADARAEAAGAH
jgi:hypothetical protein